jgi:hypothetical protein
MEENKVIGFNISGTILKWDNSPFTERENYELLDEFIKFVESKNLAFLGKTS